MEPRSLLGSAGFSSQSTTRPALSSSQIPIRVASPGGTGSTAIVTSAPFAWWAATITR